jgi:hypothetical protein
MTILWILAPVLQSETPELRVVVASTSDKRGGAFESFLKAAGHKPIRVAIDGLSKEKVQDCDVVLLDPEPGEANKFGQSARVRDIVKEDWGRPVMAVGAPGSYALIPLQLKFGNNG